ncbi:MAG: rRNA maturation RNase YbeY [Bdellovibrio sp.]|nr:rRNA maturation RNase YbeY [Bdellovibrio sp.]
MNVIVVNETKTKLNSKRINNVAHQVIEFLLAKNIRNKKILLQKKEITFVFLSANRMRKINLQFRGKDKPTDVLSFTSADPELFGELIFCLDVLKKQAREQKHSIDRELLYMMIHGCLHLLGYDHELSKLEEKRMFALQDQGFEQLSYIKTIL